MSKRLKNGLIAIFGALLLLCAILLISSPVSAKAEEITKIGIKDENYSFLPGASVRGELFSYDNPLPGDSDFKLEEATYDLGFYLKINDVDDQNLIEKVEQYYTWWGSRGDNFFVYEFTLYHANVDGDGKGSLGTGDKQTQVLLVIFPVISNNQVVLYAEVGVKNYYGNGTVDVSELLDFYYTNVEFTDYRSFFTSGRTYRVNDVDRSFGGKGYNVAYKGFIRKGIDFQMVHNQEGLYNILAASVLSPFESYFVRMRYLWHTVNFAGMFTTGYSQVYGEIDSSSRSVNTVLSNMYDAGVDFDEQFGDSAEYAYLIIREDLKARVKIKYLTEIEGTPFAAPVYAYVTVPVIKNTININDVESALNLDLSKCLDSNAYCFQKDTEEDEGEIYRLYYLKDIWLRSFTTDGNYIDTFLDINNSYKDTYYQFVRDEVLTQEQYEYFYSQMLNEYPALTEYKDSDNLNLTFATVYGYFGIVVIPESNSLNSMFAKLFDIPTSKSGAIKSYNFKKSLSYDAYQTLLTQYNYGFLSKAWAEVVGFIQGTEQQANYYVIYSQPGTKITVIGEGGQDDVDDKGGAIEQNVIQPVTEFVSDVAGTALESGKTVLNAIKGIFTNTTGVYIVGAIVIAGVIIFLYIKYGGKFRRRK